MSKNIEFKCKGGDDGVDCQQRVYAKSLKGVASQIKKRVNPKRVKTPIENMTFIGLECDEGHINNYKYSDRSN